MFAGKYNLTEIQPDQICSVIGKFCSIYTKEVLPDSGS